MLLNIDFIFFNRLSDKFIDDFVVLIRDLRKSTYVKYRSSRPELFCKKGVLRNFFFNKVAGLGNFIKKEALAKVFSSKFCKFLRTPFLTEHFQWLLLKISNPDDTKQFKKTCVNLSC